MEESPFLINKREMLQFQYIELRLVTFDKQRLIRKNHLTVSVAVMKFKKRCHDKLSITALWYMFVDTLSRFFSLNGQSIFSTSVPHLSFRFANVVFTTSWAGEGVNNVSRITSKVVTNFKWFICTFECEMCALLNVVTAFARAPARFVSIWIILTIGL